MPAVEPLPFTFAKNAACAVYGSIRFVDEQAGFFHNSNTLPCNNCQSRPGYLCQIFRGPTEWNLAPPKLLP
jgi:hypothetical protein